MSRDLTIDYVRHYFEKEGYVLISCFYKNNRSKLDCICPNGHMYSTTWFNWHSNGSRCPKCNGGKRLSVSSVVDMLMVENYILISNYINSKTKFLAVCPAGHLCSFTANSWSNGVRCKVCKNANRSSEIIANLKEEFISEGYKLLTNQYVNSEQLVEFVCNNGHNSYISVRSWARGHRCRKCSSVDKPLIDDVSCYVEKYGYKLLSDEYVNSRDKLDLMCPNGHEYSVSFDHFKSKGSRCNMCAHSLRTETKLFNLVDAFCNNNVVLSRDRWLINPYELDIVVPDKNIAIEYCGLYWHSSKFKDKNYHFNKLIKCSDIGYDLITIFEDEFVHRNKVVLNKLKLLLSEHQDICISKFFIKDVSSDEISNFCDDNLTDKFISTDINLGLYDLSNTLVSVMSLLFDNSMCIVLKNYCSVINNDYVIVSMFLDYIEDNFDYEYTIMRLSRRWYSERTVAGLFDEVLYKEPTYKYVDNNGVSRTDNVCDYKIWNCGHIEFKKYKYI